MSKIKAKIKFEANTFGIIEKGDFVICSVSKKEIPLDSLNYWNVDLHEAYFSPVEAQIRYEELKKKK